MGRSVYNSTTGTWTPTARVVISGIGNLALEVTCDSVFAGQVISATMGTKTLTQICPSTSPYKVRFEGVEIGTWTISGTVYDNTFTTDVVVQDISAVLNYGFVWSTWVDTAKYLDSSDYNSLDEVLEDEEAVRELMTEHACVDYLAQFEIGTPDLEKVINNDLCAKWINNRDYALDTLYANTIIADLMDEADKYFYGEWTLVSQAPDMTSATAPYGEVFAKNYANNDNPPYFAFDSRVTLHHHWTSRQNDTTNQYIGYHFPSAQHIQKVVAINYNNSYLSSYIEASIDGTTYTRVSDILTFDNPGQQGSELQRYEYDLYDDGETYTYYRLFIIANNMTDYCCCHDLKFYNWAPKGNVPIMTSNTAPYGEVSASATVQTYYPYNLFDNNDSTIWIGASSVTGQWVKYKFTNPMCAKRVKLKITTNAGHDINPIIKGSNDDTTYTDLGTFSTISTVGEFSKDLEIDNYYLYYMVYFPEIINVTNSWVITFSTLQFYGRELSVSVPKMDTNTTPYGTIFSLSNASNAYQLVDAPKDGSITVAIGTTAGDAGTRADGYVGYDFREPVCIKHAWLANRTGGGIVYSVNSCKLQASDDGTNFVDVADGGSGTQSINYFNNNNNERHRYWRIFLNVTAATYTTHPQVCGFQFYGLDYSEREFEEGTTKKWLYDHGVTPNGNFTISCAQPTLSTIDIGYDELFIKMIGDGNSNFVRKSIDLSNYSLMRAKIGHRLGSSDQYGEGFVVLTPNTVTEEATLVVVNSVNNPNTFLALDVSSFSTLKDVAFDNGGNTSGARYCSLTEWWLE